MDTILDFEGLELGAVVQLVVPDGELADRLLARANESGRTDDNEVVINHRLELYHEQTELVVSLYSERGILIEVDGTGAVGEVTKRALHAIQAASSGLSSSA